MRAGSVPLGNLRAGEFVLFTSHVSAGVGLPISSFLLLLLEDFGLQLQHLMPHSLLLTSIFVHLCEMFVGVRPCVILFRHFFVLVKSGKGKNEVGRTTSSREATYKRRTSPDLLAESGRIGAKSG